MSRVARSSTAFAGGMKAKPAKDDAYLAWIRKLPCVVSGRHPVEAAHLSAGNLAYGHAGRGRSQKASDRWALPLAPDMHAIQHKGDEMTFWSERGINPHMVALALHGAYSEESRDELARHILSKAWRF